MRPHARPLLVSLIALVAGAGCSGDDTNQPDPPQTSGTTAETGTDDTAESTTGEDFQVRDHEGSVVLFRDGTLKDGDDGYFRLYGLFGSDLRGVGTGQLCLDKGVCIHDLPTTVGDYVELDQFFRTTESDFDWVGERVSIGNSPRDWMEMPFVYTVGTSPLPEADLEEFGFYKGSESRLDRDEIPPLGVRIEEGEWGDNVEVEAEDGIPLPVLPRLGSPAGTEVAPQAVISFEWMWPRDPKPPEPAFDRGDTPLYLRVKANELHRIYRLPEEGPYDLELGALGLNESSQVELSFGRWSYTEARLNKNDLYVYGGIEKKITTTTCPDSSFQRTNLAGESTGLDEPTLQVKSIGVSFDGILFDGEVKDYAYDAKGTGAPLPQSSSLTFTAYDADDQALCTVRYDASRATSIEANSVRTANAARIFNAYEIDLANGISDCNRLDAPVFEGYPRLAMALEATDWIFAFGEMGDSAGPLSQAYGNDWDTVEGQMYGLYIQRVLTNSDRCPDADEVYVDVEAGAVEVGAGFLYQTSACGVLNPDLVPLRYRPGAPMKGGVYRTSPVLPFDAVLPQCPPPETTEE